MPIVDLEIVCESQAEMHAVSSRELADALGAVFNCAPAHTWVRVRYLLRADYAENGVEQGAMELPAFVTVLHAHVPTGNALDSEVAAVTRAVAQCIGRAQQRVHVQYAPSAAGRQAFGGVLVR